MEGKSIEDMAEERRSHKIAVELEDLVVPVDSLRPHPRNARVGDRNKIAESLVRFGQVRPILATTDGTIVAGNHVYRAATERLGWDEIAAIQVEMTEEEADAYLLADNRLAELGGYDDEALAGLLRSIGPTGLYATGYPEDEEGLNNLLRRLAPGGGEEYEMGSQEPTYRCPECGYEWDGESRPPRVV